MPPPQHLEREVRRIDRERTTEMGQRERTKKKGQGSKRFSHRGGKEMESHTMRGPKRRREREAESTEKNGEQVYHIYRKRGDEKRQTRRQVVAS